jgi:hypothetical protein
MTLVEVVVSMAVLASVMLGFLGAFVQSRRITESNVLQAASTSLAYGIIEQIKQLDYATLLPNYETDPDAGSLTPPYLRVRLNQDSVVWLRVVHNTDPDNLLGPTSTPDPTATAASVGAIDNFIGALPLSTVSNIAAQQINLNLWVWIDEIPDLDNDVSDVKKITVVYTYTYQDGSRTRVMRDREVFLRTRYDQ